MLNNLELDGDDDGGKDDYYWYYCCNQLKLVGLMMVNPSIDLTVNLLTLSLSMIDHLESSMVKMRKQKMKTKRTAMMMKLNLGFHF